ncbi:hypothetical protein CEXT_812021 [Caerostris extrusa]|uniref:Uncharacterized protein n=1 Tax=Caerostris extrusa TaxID=172846 RepID=A0AAV4Y8H6_CAEEX|nr:hypothetical protein CEXT_812021 [Caerostris extrusa]
MALKVDLFTTGVVARTGIAGLSTNIVGSGHIMPQPFSYIHGSLANQSAGTPLFAVVPLSPIDKMINLSPSAINGQSGNEPGGLPRDLWAEIDGV